MRNNTTKAKILDKITRLEVVTGSQLQKLFPTVNKSTIYRNLSKLESEKQIRKINIKEGEISYEINHNHSHIVCQKCGSIKHVNIPPNVLSKYTGNSNVILEITIRTNGCD